jgi:hypothetical protein
MSKLTPEELEKINYAWIHNYVFERPGDVCRNDETDMGLLLHHIVVIEAERDEARRWSAAWKATAKREKQSADYWVAQILERRVRTPPQDRGEP